MQLRPRPAAALPGVSGSGHPLFAIRLQRGIHFADDPAFRGQAAASSSRRTTVYAIKRFYDPKLQLRATCTCYESAKLPGVSELRAARVEERAAVRLRHRGRWRARARPLQLRGRARRARPALHLSVPPIRSSAARGSARWSRTLRRRHRRAHPVGTGAVPPEELAPRLAHHAGTLTDLPSRRVPWQPADRSAGPAHRRRGSHGHAAAGRRRWWIDVVEEAQPRWLSFRQRPVLTGWRCRRTYRRLVAPQGKLARHSWPNAASRLQRALQPDMAMSFFFMEHPLVGGYSAEKVALRRAIALAFDGDEPTSATCAAASACAAQFDDAAVHFGLRPGYKQRDERPQTRCAHARCSTCTGYVDRDGDGWREQPDGQNRWCCGQRVDVATRPTPHQRAVETIDGCGRPCASSSRPPHLARAC